MLRLRPALASVAVAAMFAVVILPSTPLAFAADPTTVETESMRISPLVGGASLSDPTASAGAVLALWMNSTASKTLSLPYSPGVVIRAKGQQCEGAPVMSVAVDGVYFATTSVSATSWTDYTASTTIPAGSHTIGISYSNQYVSTACTRTLSMDKVTVLPSTTPSAVPTTS